MDLSKIITITGKPGLHRVVAQGRQAVITESLVDGKRNPVPMSVRMSSLDEISMFTTGEDVPLKEVLTKLYEANGGGEAADPKGDDESLWAALTKALPTADRERIYPSDVRKLFTWYGLLLKAGEFAKADAAKGKEPEHKEEAPAKKTVEKAVKKKADAAAKVKPGGAGAAPKAAPVRRGGQRGS